MTPLEQEAWEHHDVGHDELHREVAQLRGRLAEAMYGLASFESLFRISPIPIMEQDYTRIEGWMEELRGAGVTNIREYLGDDIEAIRSIVPLIWIVNANPAAVRAVGLALEDLIGPIDPRIANDESLSSWLAQLEAVWNREPEAHAAFTAATPDGRSYDAESTFAAPVIDGEPDFSRAVFTIVDVTSHRSEERRMANLIADKNQFLASVSHEIRTPLTAIAGFGQLLAEDSTLSDDHRRFMVEPIVQQAQEASDLVEDLLVAARAEAGEIKVEAVPFDVREQIGRVLSNGGSFATNVAVPSANEPVVAIGDPARVRQILRNLLTNAERYGGSQVSVSATVVSQRILVDVSDNGPGVPPEASESIFQPYQRADSNSVRPESVGIGLTVSRQLAELMGGSLNYSREAHLSVFRLTLTAASEPEIAGPDASRAIHAS